MILDKIFGFMEPLYKKRKTSKADWFNLKFYFDLINSYWYPYYSPRLATYLSSTIRLLI